MSIPTNPHKTGTRAGWMLGLGAALLTVVCASRALAQPTPEVERDALDEDPIAVGDTADLGSVKIPKVAPKPPPMEAGAILTALPGVKAESLATTVMLKDGLAWVTTTLKVKNDGAFPSDVTWQVTAPRASGLQEAAVRTASGKVAAAATRTDGKKDELGVPVAQFTLRIAALPPKQDAFLSLVYVAESTTHGGEVRFTVPAQGRDSRVTNLAVTTDARDARGAADAPTGSHPAWLPVALRVPGALPVRGYHRFECGGRACVRRYVATPVGSPVSGTVTVLFDASPSTAGPARSRMMDAVAALLAAAPPGTRFRFVAVGARAEIVGEWQPMAADSVSLRAFDGVTEKALGAATRIDAAWDLFVDKGALRPGERWVWLGDGGMTAGGATDEAARRIRARKLPLFLFNFADRDATAAQQRFATMAGTTVVSLGAEAEAARRDATDTSLLDAMSSVFAPQVSGAPAGEGIATWTDDAGSEAPRTAQGLALLRLRAARYAPANDENLGKGIPAETVLSMLRDRIVPVARQCFRSDRHGRSDYAVAATYEFALADREVVSAKVTGKVEPELRACLAAAVDSLDVPRFTGTVVIRYPLHTAKEAPEPVIALSEDVAGSVDALVTDDDRRGAAAPSLRDVAPPPKTQEKQLK